jgi:hypothetical protein
MEDIKKRNAKIIAKVSGPAAIFGFLLGRGLGGGSFTAIILAFFETLFFILFILGLYFKLKGNKELNWWHVLLFFVFNLIYIFSLFQIYCVHHGINDDFFKDFALTFFIVLGVIAYKAPQPDKSQKEIEIIKKKAIFISVISSILQAIIIWGTFFKTK